MAAKTPEQWAAQIKSHWRKGSSVKLRQALDTYIGQDSDPDLNPLVAAVSAGLTPEQGERFRQDLAQVQRERLWRRQRRRRNGQATERLRRRPSITPNSCDVLCIASNEGPYIAEFIHHYLHQGFSNLFIGINNDSSGQTGPIVEAIAAHYPQVHAINTDRAHRRGQQRGSYASLYSHASRSSRSSHCLIVDVDEFWVANPLTLSISDFLAQYPTADVISFNWLHCHGSSLFGNPLDLSTTKLRLTDQFKSLFRYGIPVADLGAHTPTVHEQVLHITSDGQQVTSHNPAGPDGQQLSKRGNEVHPEQRPSGWVVHRHTRSDLEHAAKLLRPHANEAAAVPFKSNRNGAQPQESEASQQLARQLLGENRQAPEPYQRSLTQFISRCDLGEAIAAARAEINEATIRSRIDAIPPEVVRANQAIWRRSFRRSRFLQQLKQRAALSGSPPSSDAAV